MRGTVQGALRTEVRVAMVWRVTVAFPAELASTVKAYITSNKNKIIECLRQKGTVYTTSRVKKELTAIQYACMEKSWGSFRKR